MFVIEGKRALITGGSAGLGGYLASGALRGGGGSELVAGVVGAGAVDASSRRRTVCKPHPCSCPFPQPHYHR